MLSFAQLAGLSAWLAAVMTVVGMVTLLLFFGERHPAAAVGGLVAFGSSLALQLYLGSALLSRNLVVPDWNV